MNERAVEHESGDPSSTRLLECARMTELFSALSVHGGAMSGDALASRISPHVSQPIAVVARWIVSRDIVTFNWEATTWVPMFQFGATTRRPRPVMRDVIQELSGVLDDTEIVRWFVEPNHWLGDHSPATLLDDRTAPGVLNAARFDCLLARH